MSNKLLNLIYSPFMALSFLRKPLYWWIRVKHLNKDVKADLNLQNGIATVYVFRSWSFLNLLILIKETLGLKLPTPKLSYYRKLRENEVAYTHMANTGFFQAERDPEKYKYIENLVRHCVEDQDYKIQLVPVTVMWGRGPGVSSTDRSLFKLLFTDDENAGFWRRFFIIIAQGRQTMLHFGKPILLHQTVIENKEKLSSDDIGKMIKRVLKVHFSSQRRISLGPSVEDLNRMASRVLKTSRLKEAISHHAKNNGISEYKAYLRARRYLKEIATNKTISVVQFFERILGYLWNRIFDGVEVHNDGKLRALTDKYEIIYVPCHRSHLDYLLIGWAIFGLGISTPLQAAGANLNFWPIGGMFRRVGAFFLRRSFKGNKLYSSVFSEYINYNIVHGHSMLFYPEGGRSRTGRLLEAKTGLLSMVVQSYMHSSTKPVAFLPVYVTYDRVLEVGSYVKELRGSKKERESISLVFKARGILRKKFGKAYLSFGDPIDLADELKISKPDWLSDRGDWSIKPNWLNPFVSNLGYRIMTEINSAACLTASGLYSTVLLSNPQKALVEADALKFAEFFLNILRNNPYSQNVILPKGSADELLKSIEGISGIMRLKHPDGDVLYLDETQAVLLNYYRNNFMHLLAVPSLIATFFNHEDSISEGSLLEGTSIIFPFIKRELYLRWENDESAEVVSGYISTLVELGLLVRSSEGVLSRPDVTSVEFSCLSSLGLVLSRFVERIALSGVIIKNYLDSSKAFDWKVFESHCSSMGARLSVLNGAKVAESFDSSNMKNFFDTMFDLNYLDKSSDGKVLANEKVKEFSKFSAKFLSRDIRQNIERSTFTPETGDLDV